MRGRHQSFPGVNQKMYYASHDRPLGRDSIEAANLVAAHTSYADTVVYLYRLTTFGNSSRRAGLLTLKASSALVFY